MFARTMKYALTGIVALTLTACVGAPQAYNTASVDWSDMEYTFSANPATSFNVSKGR